MTREEFDHIKQKNMGPDALALVEEVERCWTEIGKLSLQSATADIEDHAYTKWDNDGWFGLATNGGRFEDDGGFGRGSCQTTWRFATDVERETFIYLQRARQGERRAERKYEYLVRQVESAIKRRSVRKRLRAILHPEPSVIDRLVAKLDAGEEFPSRPPSPAA